MGTGRRAWFAISSTAARYVAGLLTVQFMKLLNASSSAFRGAESSATNRSGFAVNSLSPARRKFLTKYSVGAGEVLLRVRRFFVAVIFPSVIPLSMASNQLSPQNAQALKRTGTLDALPVQRYICRTLRIFLYRIEDLSSFRYPQVKVNGAPLRRSYRLGLVVASRE